MDISKSIFLDNRKSFVSLLQFPRNLFLVHRPPPCLTLLLPSNYRVMHLCSKKEMEASDFSTADSEFGKLPDHLLIEVFIRVPICDWVQISSVKKQWAKLFRGQCLWQAALAKAYPSASKAKRWPGPIPRGLSRRRFTALYVSRQYFAVDDEMDEIVGHTYLFLKDQLEISAMPPSSVVLHGTLIDQFIACGKSIDEAHELASQIWLAVIDNLVENESTFLLLKRLALESNVFLPYPYSRSVRVQWRIYEKLLTDFRDCLSNVDYYEILASAKSNFQPIPSNWLGY